MRCTRLPESKNRKKKREKKKRREEERRKEKKGSGRGKEEDIKLKVSLLKSNNHKGRKIETEVN